MQNNFEFSSGVAAIGLHIYKKCWHIFMFCGPQIELYGHNYPEKGPVILLKRTGWISHLVLLVTRRMDRNVLLNLPVPREAL